MKLVKDRQIIPVPEPFLFVQWEIADVPNDSSKRSKKGKANQVKAVSPQKSVETHSTSLGQNASVFFKKGMLL